MARSSGTRPKGSGIPAKGSGWGGPAKGASASRIDEGEAGDAIRAQRWDPAKLADAAALEAEMMGVLYVHATSGETGHVCVAAADKMLDRLKGKPKQATDVTLRNVNADDLTDDELAAIAAGRGGAASGPAGNQD